LVKQWQPGGR